MVANYGCWCECKCFDDCYAPDYDSLDICGGCECHNAEVEDEESSFPDWIESQKQ